MGTIKTTNIEPIADNGTVTLGSSGDTFTVPSGVTITNNGTQTGFGGTNTPAFEAYLSTNQTFSDASYTKVNFNTEIYDTNNNYDNSTNYRFTPTVAGKYFVYIMQRIIVTNNTQMITSEVNLYKNGTEIDGASSSQNLSASYIRAIMCPMTATVDMNGTTDYLEAYGFYNAADGVTSSSGFHSSGSKFGAYRIGS